MTANITSFSCRALILYGRLWTILFDLRNSNLIWEARIDLDMYNIKMISLDIRHSETRIDSSSHNL